MDDLLSRMEKCAVAIREISPACTAILRTAAKRINELEMDKFQMASINYAKGYIRDKFLNDDKYHDELLDRTVAAMRDAPATTGFRRAAEYILLELLKEG